MTARLKALNERREQLKAGITASTRKRAKITKAHQATDRMRAILGSLKVLQDSQLKDAQTKLAQAGIRSKDAAIMVIFARMVMPIMLGGGIAFGVYALGWFPSWGGFKRYLLVAGTLVLSYKAPDLFVKNKITKRTAAIRKGLPDALDLLVICAEAGLTVDAAFHRVARELGKGLPSSAMNLRCAPIELGFLTDRRDGVRESGFAHRAGFGARYRHDDDPDREIRHPLASALRVLSAEFRHERMMKAEEKGRTPARDHDCALILFILPVLFIVILGPAACSISDNMMKT